MKKLVGFALPIIIIMGIGSGSALAANSLKDGTMGISVGFGDSVFGDINNSVIDITGRYFIIDDVALLAGFGIETHGGDADGDYLSCH